MTRADWFSRFSSYVARYAGRPIVFCAACLIVIVWAALGPLAGFSAEWQLVINTGTTIVTFLMVFIIQNTQTRDTAALQIKLDELIRTTAEANNALLGLEELSQEDLDRYHRLYERLAKVAAKKGVPDLEQPPPQSSGD
jgi:low affinity Fe/Cu permease